MPGPGAYEAPSEFGYYKPYLNLMGSRSQSVINSTKREEKKTVTNK